MKVNKDSFEISGSESISWKEVQTLKLLNTTLVLVLKSGRVIELPDLRTTTTDAVFRSYEAFLKDHPKKLQA